MLIINNFHKATNENKASVENVFQKASQYMTWATTLVGLNRGFKIKPLYGNIDNSD